MKYLSSNDLLNTVNFSFERQTIESRKSEMPVNAFLIHLGRIRRVKGES